MTLWMTLTRRVVHQMGRWLTIEAHTVQLPDGRVIEDWPWIITPDYINVVPIMEDGRFLLFRQTKYAAGALALAPVGGYIEPGEDPLVAAQRELLEETGCRAEQWHDLGRYVVDGNRGAGAAHFFVAEGARMVAAPVADDLEEQEWVLLSRAEVQAAFGAGDYRVLPWAAVVALALLWLDEKG